MIRIKGWNKWIIHPFTYIYGLMALCVGYLDVYLMVLSIVCFHEYCHYLFARYYHFDIECIKVLPFGAFLLLNDYGLKRIEHEAIVILAGLCSHLFLYFIFIIFDFNSSWFYMNQLILFFNILPIYPLDGSKLLLLVLSLFMDYQQAIQLQIKISLMVLSLMIVLFLDIQYIVVFGYLFYCNYRYIKEYRYMLIRFYLVRKQCKIYSKKRLNKDYSYYRSYHNYYLTNEGFIDELFIIDHLISYMN